MQDLLGGQSDRLGDGLSSPAPIFILGVMERSGTSFLYHLLCHHPDCIPGTAIAIWEDYFLTHSDILEKYVQTVSTEWSAKWDVSKRVGPPDLLLRFFGNSIISYLERQRSTSSSKAGCPRSSCPMSNGWFSSIRCMRAISSS